MAKYQTEIIRIIRTVVEVDAVTFASAKRQVESYGLVEASCDYPVSYRKC